MTEQANKFYDQMEEIVRRCKDEESDVLIDLATIKQMEKVLKSAKERVEEMAVNKLDRDGEKTYAHHGYIFTKTNGRANWNYDDCPSHVDLKEKLKKVEADLQANFRYMERHGAISVNSETGEIGEIPKVKYSKDYVTVRESKR